MIDSMAVLPVFLAFAGSAALGPVLIPVLTRLKMDQTERELGVKSHLQKAGTPTMGGIIFLIPVTVVSLIFIWKYPKIGPVLFLMLAFGLIGFLDDYLKVVKKQSDGLLPKQKLARWPCSSRRRWYSSSMCACPAMWISRCASPLRTGKCWISAFLPIRCCSSRSWGL